MDVFLQVQEKHIRITMFLPGRSGDEKGSGKCAFVKNILYQLHALFAAGGAD